MANMKATIIEEAWDADGNFTGVVLVENALETWSSGGGRVHFSRPEGAKHTRATIKEALKAYAADHAAQCDSDLLRGNPPNVSSIDSVYTDAGTETPLSQEARRLRRRFEKASQAG